MMLQLQIFLVCLIVIVLIFIFRFIKKKHLSMKYGIFWLLLLCLLLIPILFPKMVEVISEFLGFEVSSNMVFLFAFVFLFYVIFVLYINVSKLVDQNKTLTQELSLLKAKIEQEDQK